MISSDHGHATRPRAGALFLSLVAFILCTRKHMGRRDHGKRPFNIYILPPRIPATELFCCQELSESWQLQ